MDNVDKSKVWSEVLKTRVELEKLEFDQFKTFGYALAIGTLALLYVIFTPFASDCFSYRFSIGIFAIWLYVALLVLMCISFSRTKKFRCHCDDALIHLSSDSYPGLFVKQIQAQQKKTMRKQNARSQLRDNWIYIASMTTTVLLLGWITWIVSPAIKFSYSEKQATCIANAFFSNVKTTK
jgi:hypothetical protein